MSEEGGGTWGQLVPELAYDLIGRIPAGIVFWLLILGWLVPARVVAQITPADLAAIPFAMFFIVLVIGSYVVVIVTVPLSVGVRWSYARLAWRRIHSLYCDELGELFERFRPSALDENGKCKPFNSIPTVHFRILHSFLHEHLKHADPQAKVLLPKISAETRLCDNLVALLCLFAVIYLSIERQLPDLESLVAFCLVLALVLAAAWYRYQQLLSRLVAYAATEGWCGPRLTPSSLQPTPDPLVRS